MAFAEFIELVEHRSSPGGRPPLPVVWSGEFSGRAW
jgi:hypothetical protein